MSRLVLTILLFWAIQGYTALLPSPTEQVFVHNPLTERISEFVLHQDIRSSYNFGRMNKQVFALVLPKTIAAQAKLLREQAFEKYSEWLSITDINFFGIYTSCKDRKKDFEELLLLLRSLLCDASKEFAERYSEPSYVSIHFGFYINNIVLSELRNTLNVNLQKDQIFIKKYLNIINDPSFKFFSEPKFTGLMRKAIQKTVKGVVRSPHPSTRTCMSYLILANYGFDERDALAVGPEIRMPASFFSDLKKIQELKAHIEKIQENLQKVWRTEVYQQFQSENNISTMEDLYKFVTQIYMSKETAEPIKLINDYEILCKKVRNSIALRWNQIRKAKVDVYAFIEKFRFLETLFNGRFVHMYLAKLAGDSSSGLEKQLNQTAETVNILNDIRFELEPMIKYITAENAENAECMVKARGYTKLEQYKKLFSHSNSVSKELLDIIDNNVLDQIKKRCEGFYNFDNNTIKEEDISHKVPDQSALSNDNSLKTAKAQNKIDRHDESPDKKRRRLN